MKSGILPVENNDLLLLPNKSTQLTADDYIHRARLAEKTLRYEDMLAQIRHVVQLKTTLTADERNLLALAYKNAVTTRRTGVCVCVCVTRYHVLFFFLFMFDFLHCD
jgi:hypothetical protein